MHVLNIKFVCKPGKRDEVLAMLDPPMMDQVQKEPATLLYLMQTEDADSNAIWFWMIYTDEDGFVEHTKSEVEQSLSPKFRPLLDSIEFHKLTVVGGKGAPV